MINASYFRLRAISAYVASQFVDTSGITPLSTLGSNIVDAQGKPFRIAAVHWGGMDAPTLCPHRLGSVALGSVAYKSGVFSTKNRFWVAGQSVFSYGPLTRTELVTGGRAVSRFQVTGSGAGFGMNIAVTNANINISSPQYASASPPTITYSASAPVVWRITDTLGWNMATTLPATSGQSTLTLPWTSFTNTGYQKNTGSPPLNPGASAKYEFIPSTNPLTFDLAWLSPVTSTPGYTGILDAIKATGLNAIRFAVCEDVTWPGRKPPTNDPFVVGQFLNTDFVTDIDTAPMTTVTSIEILDKIIAHCKDIGLRVILDMHCLAPNSDNVAGTLGKWYTTANPGDAGQTAGVSGELRSEQQFLDAWAFLANRYRGEPTVIGADLINEPHACTWDDDPNTGIVALYERAADIIHENNPDWLVFCEGIYEVITVPSTGQEYGVRWGAGLTGVASRPVEPAVPNKVVYSPHEYGFYKGGNFLEHGDWPDVMNGVFDVSWGYIAREGIAPIWVGEFGALLKVGADNGGYTQERFDLDDGWIRTLLGYMNGDNGYVFPYLPPDCAGMSWAWFLWADFVQGLTESDYITPRQYLIDYLVPYMQPRPSQEVTMEDDSGQVFDEDGQIITTE